MAEPMTVKYDKWFQIFKERNEAAARLRDAEAQMRSMKRELAELKSQINAMTPDYELGGLVGRMPVGWELMRDMFLPSREPCWYVGCHEGGKILTKECTTPEAALCEALGEEQDVSEEA